MRGDCLITVDEPDGSGVIRLQQKDVAYRVLPAKTKGDEVMNDSP
jgi:hypothetical protein